MKKIYTILLYLFTTVCVFSKQEFTPDQINFFEAKIRPVLVEKCLECHSSEKGKVKGGLSLDSRDNLLKGGESGDVVNFKNINESVLIKAINWDGDLHMPEKVKLSQEQINDITEWVKQKLPDSREAVVDLKTKRQNFWTFQPVVKPKVPYVKNEAWCYNTIDRFVLAKLEEKNMLPAMPAHKEILLRRAYFDLIGVPPTPKQIEEFIADNNSNAFEKIVDRLLADPGYGERWGRHWLDTARYSDTTGAINNIRLNDYRYAYAWTYRDWVINAFNNDMPYDLFLKNQIAADKIPDNSKENLTALGFLTVGQRFNQKDDIINDRIDAIGRGMLGLTISCARCHDHKFDPVTSADYYALRGVFSSITEPEEGPIVSGNMDSPTYKEFLAKLSELETKASQGFYNVQRTHSDKLRKNAAIMAEYVMLTSRDSTPEQIKQATELINKNKLTAREITDSFGRRFRVNDKVLGLFVKLQKDKEEVLQGNFKEKYSPIVVNFIKSQQTLPNTTTEIAQLIGKFFLEFEPKVPSLYAQIMDKNTSNPANKDELELATFPFPLVLASDLTIEKIKDEGSRYPLLLQGELQAKTGLAKINEFKLTHNGGPVRAMVVEDISKPINSPLFVRGNAPKAGEEIKIIPRRFLEVLDPSLKQFNEKDSGRLDLAEAIASKNNPLTARVLVNRVWMYHFGEGLVKTPDDLGNQSGIPTHPEILDYLANWFMEDYGPKKPAWSVKSLHKAIMLSKTYQQASTTISKQQLKDYSEIDPSNNLLWHANVRRLDFESYRDSLLSMSGLLQRDKIGGPSFNVMEEPYIFRRTVYSYIDRANVPDVLMQFDMSNPDQPNTKRTSTIVPQQALFLMNNPLIAQVVQCVSHRPELVQAVSKEKNTDKGITSVFKIVLQRTPTAFERKMAVDFLVKEAKEQERVKQEASNITSQAKKIAEQKLKQARNSVNARQAIVNEGDIVERVTFSPWETLIQSLIFTNEAAYIN